MPFSPLRFLIRTGAVCAGLSAFILPARACGPDFPNAYLAFSAEEIAKLPTLSFPAELERLLPPGTKRAEFNVSPETATTSPAELAEVREVLQAAGRPSPEIEPALSHYSRLQPPENLPREFHLYAAGARAWHANQMANALAPWRELLSLPESERRHRTVWAAYMTGRSLGDSDLAACAAYQSARQAAERGCTDSEGLATASLGWEARVHFQAKNYPEALRLYFRQYAAGDPRAATSLQLAMAKIFQDNENVSSPTDTPDSSKPEKELQAIASDRLLRGIVTAWFVSRGGPHAPWTCRATQQFQRWLAALPKDGTLDATESDRWAWAAYQNGLWETAATFAQQASPKAPASEWVRAMLLLRSGDAAGAIEHLSGAARVFPDDPALQSKLFNEDDTRFYSTREDLPTACLSGVRGVLALQREQYIESLRLFLTAGHWADAAYVAERVLTVSELETFIKAEVPPPPDNPKEKTRDADATDPASPTGQNLRYLLARKLVRSGQFDHAREFFPADQLGVFDRYVSAVRTGYCEDLPSAERAKALWTAAQLCHDSGMEIQGTELEPDFSIWGGSFEWPATSHMRHTDDSHWRWFDRSLPTSFPDVISASEDEFSRIAKSRSPTRRFHYRQRAAQLALLATTLLPDNDDQTALILNTAGRWLAARYPEDADLFYKTLTFRCPKTELGKAAIEKHWLVLASDPIPNSMGE